MARIDLKNKVIQAKLVYYGPGLCGKTTNLEFVNRRISGGQELMSLATEGDRTIFFDYMPFEIGQLRGMDVKFKLYTVPGQVRYNETRKMVLKNTDGIVFVADSQELMMDANVESFHNMFANLRELGIAPDDVTIVLQYNKRDLAGVLSPEDLDNALNTRRYPRFLASAMKGDGVLETLKEACTRTLNRLVVQLPTREGRPDAPPSAVKNALASARSPSTPNAAAVQTPVPNMDELLASTKTLLAESCKVQGLLKEQLAQLRELGAGTRTGVDSLRVLLGQAAKKTDLDALGRQVDRIGSATQSSARPSEAVEQRLALLPSRADVERQVESLAKLLRERVNGPEEKPSAPAAMEPSLQQALEKVATKAELSALGQTLGKLPSRADIEQICDATSKRAALSSDALRELGAQWASRNDVQALGQRFAELPVRSDIAALMKRLAELPTRQELQALEARLEGLATKEDLAALGAALRTPRPEGTPKTPPPKITTVVPPDEPPTAPEEVERPAPLRTVTKKSWPPVHAPVYVKETIRPEGAYPPDDSAREAAPAEAQEAPEAPPVAEAQAPEAEPSGDVEASAPAEAEAETPSAETPASSSPPDAPAETEPPEKREASPPPAAAEASDAAESVPEAPPAPLTDAQQQNAARIARVMVADLHLYHREDVEEGIRHDDFFERNKEALADMRTTYEMRVPAEVREHTDFFETAVRDFIAKKRKQLGVE